MSQTLKSWNESMTLQIMCVDKFISIAEFQVHNNRDNLKCRINMDNIIRLVDKNFISGVSIQKFPLKNKYNIKVIRGI